MSLPDALLAPIEADDPAGPDMSLSNEYADIARLYREADEPSTTSPGGAEGSPALEIFGDVVLQATDFIETKSKDIKIAGYLAGAWLHQQGFGGLADGLELLRGLLEQYWDAVHPRVAGRAAVLNWLGSDDFSYALFTVPLTEAGHTYFQYKDWSKAAGSTEASSGGAKKAGSEQEDDTPGGGFEQAFALTAREWYVALDGALRRCSENLEALDALGRESFPKEDEKPPRYNDLRDGIKKVSVAAADLLGRKPAPATASGGAETAGISSGAASGMTGAQQVVVAEPRDPDEAAAAIAAAARVLRRADPLNPAPYLLLRGFRWGELRAAGEDPDPRVLSAPATEQRTHLKSLFLDQKWDELLEASEAVMATPAGRAWLDLQRYTILAAERLGAEYRHVAGAIRGALGALIADLPELVGATLMDDSAVASADTLAWLTTQGLIDGAEAPPKSEPDGDADTDAERIVREATFGRAAALARSGDPQGAIELLMERAERERSERARFITKAQAAGIMVAHDMRPVARPILEELQELIKKHTLEDWEVGEVVAKPLGLLYQCLQPTDGALRQQLYQRLCKLDPLMAMAVDRASGGGTGAAAKTATAAPPPPEKEAGASDQEGTDGE